MKKLLIFLIMLLCVTTVSAWDFDNVKDYDEELQEITIKNAFGLPFIGDDLAKYRLTYNTYTCLDQCYAEGEATLYTDALLFQGVTFKDNKGKEKAIKEYNFYYEVSDSVDVEIEDYHHECHEEFENITDVKEVCVKVVDGNRTEERITYSWKKYQGEALPPGDYKWRIEGKKEADESVDWIASAFGVDLDEWAWWNGDYVFKRKLYINNSGSTTLSNFPFLVNGTLGFDVGTDPDESQIVWANVESLTNANQTYYLYYTNNSFYAVTNETEANQMIMEVEFGNESDYGSIKDFWEEGDYIAVFHGDTVGTNASDSVGYVNGTYLNNAVSAVGGKFGNAFYFDGTGDAVLLSNPAVPSHFNLGDVWTLSYWVALNGTGTQRVISAALDAGCGGETYLGLTTNAEVYRFAIAGDYQTSGFVLNAHQWYHVTLRKNTSSVGLYVNGIANETFAVTNNLNLECYIEDDAEWWTLGGEDDGNQGWLGFIDEVRLSNTTRDDAWILQEYETGNSFLGGQEIDVQLTTTLNAPLNNTNFSTQAVTFNCSATDETAVLNLTLIFDGIDNYTIYNTSANQNLSLEVSRNLADASYLWNCRGEDIGSRDLGAERNLTIDTTAPTIDTVWNVTTNVFTLATPINNTFNYSVSDLHLADCWFNTSDDATIQLNDCNISTVNASFSVGGTKQIYYYANDSVGNEVYANQSFEYQFAQVSQAVNKETIIAGTNAEFNLTINYSAIPSVTSTLWYNDTGYSVSTSASSPDQYNSTRILTIPSDVGNSTGDNVTWFWEWKLAGIGTLNTSKEGQTVTAIEIGNCSFYDTEIINWTLYDEGEDALLAAPLRGANVTEVEIDLTLISTEDSSRTWAHNELWTNHSNGSICVPDGVFDTPNELYLDMIATFRNNGTHVEEFFFLDKRVLSNSTTPQIQFYRDLNALDSTSFITSFQNEFGIAQEDVIISVLRYYIGEGVYKEVERAKTDDDGETVLHLVEEDVVYIFNVTEEDASIWTSTDYRVYCEDVVSGTSCRIALNEDPALNNTDPEWGEAPTQNYEISFNRSTRVITFVFQLNGSALMNITAYEYTFNNTAINEAIATNTTTDSSGTMTLTLPPAYGNKTILLEIYKADSLVTSKTISFMTQLSDYTGTTLALFFASLILLTLGLISVNLGARAVAASTIVSALFLFGIGLINSSSNLVPLSTFIILIAVLIIWVLSGRRSRT